MNEEDLTLSIRNLETGLKTLTQEWGDFLSLESKRREDILESKKDLESTQSRLAAAEASEWERRQTFFSKHGIKILALIIPMITGGLAWYGAQVRSEMDAEAKDEEMESIIKENSNSFNRFKLETFAKFKVDALKDIRMLKIESVNQTIMIDEGFRRMESIMIKGTRIDAKDLPPRTPEFQQAVEEAKRKKTLNDKFGELDGFADSTE